MEVEAPSVEKNGDKEPHLAGHKAAPLNLHNLRGRHAELDKRNTFAHWHQQKSGVALEEEEEEVAPALVVGALHAVECQEKYAHK